MPNLIMVQTTFNLLDQFGLLEKIYLQLANFTNKHVLKRNTLNTELIADAFNSLDAFWLKHGKTKWYGESEIRVIVGTIAESLRDNSLTSSEVRTIVNYVTAKWRPDVAIAKADSTTISPEIESNALKAVEIYRKVEHTAVKPETFVSLASKAISKNIPNKSIVNGVLSILGRK